VSALERLRSHVREHRRGMLLDLVFAMVWVSVVSLLFDVVDGPRWAYYLLMAAGVVAYFGFFWSLSLARERAEG